MRKVLFFVRFGFDGVQKGEREKKQNKSRKKATKGSWSPPGPWEPPPSGS